jgi:uncharacterized protein DUF2867
MSGHSRRMNDESDVSRPSATARAVPSGRLPDGAHLSRPWRIHEIVPDFDLEDVWALPATGGPDDFAQLISSLARARSSRESPAVVRFIWAVRWRLGRWFGWDESDKGLGSRVRSLRARLPEDLRDGDRGPEMTGGPFSSLFLTRDEYAAEIANQTVHGVLHLGWVQDRNGDHRGQMAVLVKVNGRWGRAYMALIKPFRYAFVYPAMLRQVECDWNRAHP